jgi:hypothetical protein
MIANAFSVVIGIWLVYAAVLNPILVSAGQRGGLTALAAGLVLVALGFAARRGAYSRWHANSQMTLASVLVLLALIELATALPDILTYWVTFWVGLLVAFIALWAALYQPRPADV